MSSDTADLSKHRFVVFIYELRETLAFAEEFTGQYTKSVTLSDGTTRNVELTPMMRNGMPVVELKGTGGSNWIGMMRVLTATQTHGKLMVQVLGLDDRDTARAEAGGSRQPKSSTSPVLPADTSLISMPDFVPPGFIQGIEILNNNTTPMEFVVDVLRTYLDLSTKDATYTMLAIHTRGGVLLPTPSLTEAERIAAQIAAEAAKHNYPLICRSVSIGPRTGPVAKRD
jgi:ATP-dependent Clp protease adapter protein ClpS